jgi:hypothetical protein
MDQMSTRKETALQDAVEINKSGLKLFQLGFAGYRNLSHAPPLGLALIPPTRVRMIIPIARYFCSNTCECNLDSQDTSPRNAAISMTKSQLIRGFYPPETLSYRTYHRTAPHLITFHRFDRVFILGTAVTLVASPCDVI